MGSVAHVQSDDHWTTAVKLEAGDTFAKYFHRCCSGTARDVRLLGDVRDQDGVRFVTLREALRLSREVPVDGWEAAVSGARCTTCGQKAVVQQEANGW